MSASSSIAIAILVGSVFLGIVIYMRGYTTGTTEIFAIPQSRVARWLLISIVFANITASLGVLTFGGWCYDCLSWCGILLCVYYCARGVDLLLQPHGR